jgi:hypothetical protein
MLGVSNSPVARSAETRSAKRPFALSATSLSLTGLFALLAGASCDSALADGNPAFGNDPSLSPFSNPNGTGGNGSNPANPGSPNGSSSLNPERNPSLSTIENNGPTTDENGAPLSADQLQPLTACATPGPRQIRRLSSQQYRNTLVEVFGADDVPDAPVLRDPATLGYNVDADDSLIEGLDADALMGHAEDIAEWAVSTNKIERFSNGCNNNDQNCQQNFIRNLGKRMSRETIDDERLNRFRGLFDGEGVDSFQEGASRVISAMVQSPYMLYRRELGPTDPNQTTFQLTAFEVASELSYFLTNRPPDDTLMQAAEQGRLASQDDIDREAARLLATPEAAEALGQFVRGWTDIDRLLTKAKDGADFSPELRQDMIEETVLLFSDILNREDGTIGELFGAQYTFLNQRLADFYGMQGAATGDDFVKVDISDGRRVSGLLGHGSYLAAHALADNSSPVQRAFVVRERFLCNDLPEVPTNLDTNLKPAVATDTSRERYGRHSSEEPCRSCHKLMDPIGFTFENYDGFGRFRDTEAGKPVDSSGGVPIMEGKTLVQPEKTFPLNGVDELADYLGQLEDVRACMINNLAYYSYGIANEAKWPSSNKLCTDNSIRQEARDSGNTLKSALMGVLHAPHFTSRVKDL